MTRLRKRVEAMVSDMLNAYHRELSVGRPDLDASFDAERRVKAFSESCAVAEDKVGDIIQEVLDEQDAATRDWAHGEEEAS